MKNKSLSFPDTLENLFEQSKMALEKALTVRKRAQELRGNSASVIAETNDLKESMEKTFKDYRLRNSDDSLRDQSN